MDLPVSGKIISNLKQEYSRLTLDGEERFVESMGAILRRLQKPGGSVHRFLEEITQMIYRTYRIREVSIGLRNLQDGSYQYVSFCGFRKDAENALRSLRYTKKDFDVEQVGKHIGGSTWVFLTEDKPFVEGEEGTYNRPIMLGRTERQSIDQCLEADYFDLRMYDRRNDMIGWIEYSGTQTYQFPDMRTIKEIELVGSIISLALQTSIPM